MRRSGLDRTSGSMGPGFLLNWQRRQQSRMIGSLEKADRYQGVKPPSDPTRPKEQRTTVGRALRDPTFVALDPKSVPAPPELLQKIGDGRRVVIMPHVPVDGDTLGSALGLANALEALGKDVVIALEALVPGDLRGLDKRKLIHPDALDPADFDLAIVVDVAQAERVGKSQRILSSVPNVVVIDHHLGGATPTSLKLAPGAELVTWIEPTQDSAAVMVARVATQLLGGNRDAATMARVTFPLLAGMFLDTDKFRAPASKQDSLAMFKWMLQAYHGGEIRPLLRAVTHRLPEVSLALLRGSAPTEAGASARFSRTINTAMTVIPKSVTDEALRLAQITVPDANILDVRGAAMARLDWMLNSATLAVTIFETDEGVQLSVRSREQNYAVELATLLGGGGQSQKAAAAPDIPIEKVAEVAGAFMERYEAARLLKLRCGH